MKKRTSDIPVLTAAELAATRRALPPPKRLLSVRLDVDVIDWLKENGVGYQTRMNAILRTVMTKARAK